MLFFFIFIYDLHEEKIIYLCKTFIKIFVILDLKRLFIRLKKCLPTQLLNSQRHMTVIAYLRSLRTRAAKEKNIPGPLRELMNSK